MIFNQLDSAKKYRPLDVIVDCEISLIINMRMSVSHFFLLFSSSLLLLLLLDLIPMNDIAETRASSGNYFDYLCLSWNLLIDGELLFLLERMCYRDICW